MALGRRNSGQMKNAIWPGFVDAMTGLLLVLMFVLTIFMVIQFVLRETITGQAISSLMNWRLRSRALAAALGSARRQQRDLGTITWRNASRGDGSRKRRFDMTGCRIERDLRRLRRWFRGADPDHWVSRRRWRACWRSGRRPRRRLRTCRLIRSRLMSEQEALNLALAHRRAAESRSAGVEAGAIGGCAPRGA